MPDGTEAPFSPITEGLDPDGNSMRTLLPSGVAINPKGEALVCLADCYGAEQFTGILRFNTSDGKPLGGKLLPFVPGDLDCDDRGNIYVVDKVYAYWHVYNPDGSEIPGGKFGNGTFNDIQRGISVKPDSSKVYVISETHHEVRIWEGEVTSERAEYVWTGNLCEKLTLNSAGIDVMDDGTVLVCDHAYSRLLFYDKDHNPLGQISGGEPEMFAPRGAVLTPDGKTLWVVSYRGFIQRWEREADTSHGASLMR
jgi:DNA-binding beta-propeller fold protein YncE